MPTTDAETDSLAVNRANEMFYDALSRLSLEDMERLWSHTRDVRCIHPGWDVLVGWSAVREAWRSIFSSSPGLSVESEEVEVSVFGDLAWVLCLERIRNIEEGSETVSLARASNLFIRGEDGWKMILHHASPVPQTGGTDEGESIH